jgi:DNA-binding MarR family transcriptional regulator
LGLFPFEIHYFGNVFLSIKKPSGLILWGRTAGCHKLFIAALIQFFKMQAPSKPPSQPPFVDGYLAALLGQASQMISTEFHQVVRSHGFSVAEWRVLASLFGSKGMSIGHLATISLTKQPTVTRLLDRMEALGHVRRTPQTKDRRVTHVSITPQGQKIVKSLIKQAKAHEEKILEPFGFAQAEALKHTLRQIITQRRQSV